MVILHNCGKTEKQVGELLGAGADGYSEDANGAVKLVDAIFKASAG